MAENTLQTDLYQPSMVMGYIDAGKGNEMATFELSLRKMPPNRNYLLAAGLGEVVEYLSNLRFSTEQIDYLKSFPQFAHLGKHVWDALASFRFTGDLWAVREGTPVFQNEPVLFVRANRATAQFVETYVLGKIRSNTRFASRTSRIVDAAAPAEVIDFGTRHIDPELGVVEGRGSYIGGAAGTSNVESGRKYGIPLEDIRGTMAHAYVMSFATELEAFRAYAKTYPDHTVLLVDTYDTEQGIRNAISVAKEMEAAGHCLRGIRIDSGDFAKYSRMARQMLAEAGLSYVKIMLSGDLNEKTILELREKGAEFDMLGVGRAIATSDDAPHIDCAYKLCEHTLDGAEQQAIKLSEGKATWPGLKQIYRFCDAHGLYLRDEICAADECREGATPLLEKIMQGGQLAAQMPSMRQMRQHARAQKEGLSPRLRGFGDEIYPVEHSEKLKILQHQLRVQILARNGASRGARLVR
jgi:nicotinate phosphoribosyltransferase